MQVALVHEDARPVSARVITATENGRALVLALDADVLGALPNRVLFSGEVVAVQADDGNWSLAQTGGGKAVPINLVRLKS